MHIGQTVYCLAKEQAGNTDWIVLEAKVISFDEKAVCIQTQPDVLQPDVLTIFPFLGGSQEVGFASRKTVFEDREYAEAICEKRNIIRTAEHKRKVVEATLKKEAEDKVKGS